MIRLRVMAPFAAFRPLSAGSYRPSAGFLTPTAAYGLVLNLAGFCTRRDDGRNVATLTKPPDELPVLKIAVGVASDDRGAPALPSRCLLFQHVHTYPQTAKEHLVEKARGSKSGIKPARREALRNLRAVVVVKAADAAWEDRIRRGLGPDPPGPRYGLPFLGDNNFFPDRLEEASDAPAHWLARSDGRDGPALADGRYQRLTAWIDRADAANSLTRLFRVPEAAAVEIPDDAWTSFPHV